ncbi:uncharacterized protein LOC135827581 [Sycon ciliatum]|uniref:uncharacterized protein LOC135827581 n=1 Tax=Sycon ciliatum TaxID=27933 RepID=UPI0020AA2358|eukprot:scpid44863/ scgid10079/ F-box/LRR-repeat protein 4
MPMAAKSSLSVEDNASRLAAEDAENPLLCENSSRVYVENVCFDATDRQLKKFLSTFGTVHSCVIQRHTSKGRLKNGCLLSRGYAFVQFDCPSSAQKAMAADDKQLKFRRRYLRIYPAKRKRYGAGMDLESYYEEPGQESLVIEYQPVSCPGQYQTKVPPEDLVQVFQLLDRVDLLVCASICRQWYHATRLTWSAMKQLVFSEHDAPSSAWYALNSSDVFHYLSLTSFHLEELVINRRCKMDKEGLIIIGKACPRLKRLTLTRVAYTAFAWYRLTKNCPLLEEVCLEGCIDEKSMRSLLHNSPLKVLKLSWFVGTGRSFRCLPPTSQLEVVSFQHCDLLESNNLCLLLTRSPSIKSLNLSHWFLCDVDFFRCLGNLTPSLTSLCLRASTPTSLFFPNFHDPAFEVGKYRSMPPLPSLLRLDLSGIPVLTDVVLRAVVSKQSQLQALDLSECVRIGDAGMEAIGAHCPDLRVLDISFAQSVTSSGLLHIARGCALLEELYLRNCEALDDSALINIVTYCPNLVKLDVSVCWCFSRSLADTLDEHRRSLPESPTTLAMTVGGTLISQRDPSQQLQTIKLSLATTAVGTMPVDHFHVYGFLGPDIDDGDVIGGLDDPLDFGFAVGPDFLGFHEDDEDYDDDLDYLYHPNPNLDWVDEDAGWMGPMADDGEALSDDDNDDDAAGRDLWLDDMVLGWHGGDDGGGDGDWVEDFEEDPYGEFDGDFGVEFQHPIHLNLAGAHVGDMSWNHEQLFWNENPGVDFVEARHLLPRRQHSRPRHKAVHFVPSIGNWLFAVALDLTGYGIHATPLLAAHHLGWSGLGEWLQNL